MLIYFIYDNSMFKISKSPIHAHDKNALYRLFLLNSYRLKIIRNIRETQEINSLCFFQEFSTLYFFSIFRIQTFFRFQAKRAGRCGLAFEARSGDSPGTIPGQALDPTGVGYNKRSPTKSGMTFGSGSFDFALTGSAQDDATLGRVT